MRNFEKPKTEAISAEYDRFFFLKNIQILGVKLHEYVVLHLVQICTLLLTNFLQSFF